MNNIVYILLILMICSFAGSALAAPHYVMPTNGAAESPFETWAKAATNIQDAMNAASDGETVWVTNGTYLSQTVTGSMVVIDKGITLKSVHGPLVTIIDGNYPLYTNRICYMTNASAVLDGFTLTNGFMTANINSAGGAGVFMESALLVTNCWIIGNTVTNSSVFLRGPGAEIWGGKMSHCTIGWNHSLGTKSDVCAIRMYGSSAVITNCIVVSNTAVANADSILVSYGSRIANTKFYGNEGDVWISSAITMENCEIYNNKPATYAGIQLNADATIRNCLIRNQLQGIYAYDKGGKVINCTVVNNASTGIKVDYDYSGSTPLQVVNTISRYNGVNRTNNWASTNVSYTNCCLLPAAPGLNNITNAPSFVDTNNANYRLNANSPCINVGTNQTWMTNSCDFDGNPRIRYGTVDMGAYEAIYNGTIYKF